MLRRCLFWFHLAIGVAAGIVILIMSVTGVLLAYEKQIVAWVDRDFSRQPAPEGSPRLPLGALATKATEALGGALASVVFYPGERAVKFTASASQAGGGAGSVYLDGYSGEVLGTGATRVAAFFRAVTSWHRTLAVPQDYRAWGKAITGAANLGFALIVVSGLFIWWPGRNRKLSQVAWFRRGLSGKARNWNWHNALGFWSAIPLFLIALSGVVISYPWATALVHRATGTPPPAEEGNRRQGQNQNVRERDNGSPASIAGLETVDPMVATLERESGDTKDIKSITLRLPLPENAPVAFTVDRGTGGQPQLRTTVSFDRTTGAVVREESFADQNAGRRARSWLRFVHTGEYYGFVGQGIAGLASLAGVVLAWTGLSLAWTRLVLWLRSRRERRTAAQGILVNEESVP